MYNFRLNNLRKKLFLFSYLFLLLVDDTIGVRFMNVLVNKMIGQINFKGIKVVLVPKCRSYI